jgi:predicted ATP-dependent endonuclease of OLD family
MEQKNKKSINALVFLVENPESHLGNIAQNISIYVVLKLAAKQKLN